MTIDEFDEYAKAHDCVIFTRQQYEHVIDVFNDYELLLFDYYGRLKADKVAMLKELKYDLYHELCKEIHGKENCPFTNQTTSCLATFRVCDANRAIGRGVQQKMNELKGDQEGEK